MTVQVQFSKISISKDRTHHLVDGQPLYSNRFDCVLNYHDPPGYAPARDSSGAFHIDILGKQVYSTRFLQTFGYYEDLAAVQSTKGWGHIDPTGALAYETRYNWVGNFQESRCTIRTKSDFYHHILRNGSPAYGERFRFAGDFREGRAVVQGSDGLFFHIDYAGKRVSDHSFTDLDVYHKGFARAKDSLGWFHVDIHGNPIYERRFALVEPFYNGQARVQTFEGLFCIINERGDTILEFPDPSKNTNKIG